MKKLILLILFVFATTLNAQQIDYNVKKSFVAEGYDVTEYFNNKALKGDSKFVATHDNVKYKFSNKENLEKFKKDPDKFVPQYGGYCAYAIAINSKKVDINPKAFEIRDNKLYLFYDAWGTNTLNKWIDENPTKLQSMADINWQKIKTKK